MLGTMGGCEGQLRTHLGFARDCGCILRARTCMHRVIHFLMPVKGQSSTPIDIQRNTTVASSRVSDTSTLAPRLSPVMPPNRQRQ